MRRIFVNAALILFVIASNISICTGELQCYHCEDCYPTGSGVIQLATCYRDPSICFKEVLHHQYREYRPMRQNRSKAIRAISNGGDGMVTIKIGNKTTVRKGCKALSKLKLEKSDPTWGFSEASASCEDHREVRGPGTHGIECLCDTPLCNAALSLDSVSSFRRYFKIIIFLVCFSGLYIFC